MPGKNGTYLYLDIPGVLVSDWGDRELLAGNCAAIRSFLRANRVDQVGLFAPAVKTTADVAVLFTEILPIIETHITPVDGRLNLLNRGAMNETASDHPEENFIYWIQVKNCLEEARQFMWITAQAADKNTQFLGRCFTVLNIQSLTAAPEQEVGCGSLQQ